LGLLEDQTQQISKAVFDLVIYTEGSITLAEAWSIDSHDRKMIMDSFEELMKAKNPGSKNEMKQEQM
jgi:hypothetical protein